MNFIAGLWLYGKSKKHSLAAISLVAAIYVVMQKAGITCPILFLTGISCAGCGMSRAWQALLRLDVFSAFSYHPLFWLPVCVLAWYLFRNRMPGKIRMATISFIILIFMAVYLVRICNERDTVVVFQPQNGLIFRIISGTLSNAKT